MENHLVFRRTFGTTAPKPPKNEMWAKRLGLLPALILFIICLLIHPPASAVAKTVNDQFGRLVRVPDRPTRIVSMAPSITEILFALDLSDRLVGATQFSDYPSAAEALPRVGSYVRLDVEKIVALRPDLCIAVKDGNPISVVRKLESVGIPVYAVDPRNLDAVMDTLLELGRLLDVNDRAKAIVADMTGRIKQVKRQVSGADHRPVVFFQIGISPIVSIGTRTFIHELIVMAGGENPAQGRTPYPRFSKEQVIRMRPDVMIITSMARQAVFEQVKSDWQQWPELPAVKNDRIYLVESNVMDRPTPRLVDGLELMARLIHPDRFKATETGAQP